MVKRKTMIMINISVLITAATISLSAIAKPKDYIFCLGKEEAYIHKHKIGGAYSKLNKEVISGLVQLSSSIHMHKNFTKKICSKTFSSLELLRSVMTSKQPIFYTSQSGKNIAQYTIDKDSIKDFKYRTAYIFIDFLNSVQANMTKANCLTTKIPELKLFFKEMRFILEDVGLERVIKSLKKTKIIFDKLEKLPYDTNKC